MSSSSSSSSSLSCSQGLVLATAMAAVSAGTVFLLTFRLQKSLPPDHFTHSNSTSLPVLRSCISSSDEKNRKKKKKRVHFAEDLVDPINRREANINNRCELRRSKSQQQNSSKKLERIGASSIPANRMALYNGILKDRVVQRLAYSC